MARVRTSIWKSFAGVGLPFKVRPIHSYGSQPVTSNHAFQYYQSSLGSSICNSHITKGWCPFRSMRDKQIGMLSPPSPVDVQHYKTNPIVTPLTASLQHGMLTRNMLHCRSTLFPLCINDMSNRRAFSSDRKDIPNATISGDSTVDNNNTIGSDWVDNIKVAWRSSVDAANHAGKKVQEELIPYAQQIVDSHPYLKDVIIPVGWTMSATLLAWLVMPKILRRLHKYSIQTPAVLLYGKSSDGQVPYERTFWGALEDPARYLITFMAFSQLGVMIAPTTIASQYIAQAWRGAVIVSSLWFFQRWKTNVFTHALASQNIVELDRERLLSLDKLSSVGLFLLGLMASAEACGVAVQSILTVGGIGGVATAFAARDILGNVLSGLSMQFFRPFSMGDTIKAGSIEGQVVEMGLTTTSLLNSEKFPVIVPNSLFSSQVIVNKSRAQWRAMATKIPVRIDDLERIPQVSEDIKSMLRSNARVFLGKEAPYCFLSRIENSYVELTIGCNLKHMSKEEFYSTEQDILLQSARVIKKHGAQLGTLPEFSNH